MALVRKYNKAGKVEEPKKVFTYENVGTYDAEKLASQLTQDLESYADGLKLTGLTRLDFLNYGAAMINAIKDGNVTKNANGTFSINGNYGLNNTYTDSLIADKRAEGEVGRGAKKYQGTYQKSYGIFTTLGTEDFRNRNHALGLVGLWLNKELQALQADVPVVTAFSLPKYLADNLYYSNENLKKEWEALYPSQSDRFEQIIQLLEGLTDEDYNNWSITSPQLGGVSKLKTQVAELISNLRNNNITGARNNALRLGFTLGLVVNYASPGESKDFNKLALEALGIGASEQEVLDYADILRRNDELTQRNLVNKKAQDQLEILWNTFSDSEKYNIYKFLNDDVLIPPTFLDLENGQSNKERNSAYLRFVELQDSIRDTSIDTLPAVDSEEGKVLGNIIDQLIDTYDYIVLQQANLKDPKYADVLNLHQNIKEDLFDIVKYNNGGTQDDWALFRHLSTLKYSILYNPKTKEIIRVSNSLLGANNPYYIRLKDLFMTNHKALFKVDGGPIESVYTTSRGKTIDFSVLDLVVKQDSIEQAVNDSIAKEAANPTVPQEIPTELTAADKARFAAAILDILSFGASVTGAGSVASSALGIGATSANLYADLKDDNVSALSAGLNFGANLIGDVASIAPYIGAIRKRKAVMNGLKYITKVGLTLGTIYGVWNIQEHIGNITNLYNNWDDAKAWTNALQSLAFFANLAATNNSLNRAHRDAAHYTLGDYKITSKEGNEYDIPEDVYKRIEQAHTYDQANQEFLNAIQDDTQNLPFTKTNSEEKVININATLQETLPPYYSVERHGQTYTFAPSTVDRWVSDMPLAEALMNFGGNVGRKAVRTYDFLAGYRNKSSIPPGANKYSEDMFEFGGRTYTRGDDGEFHMDSLSVSEENIKNFELRQKTVKARAEQIRKERIKNSTKKAFDWVNNKFTLKKKAVPDEIKGTGTPKPKEKAELPITEEGRGFEAISSTESPTIIGDYGPEIMAFNRRNHTTIPETAVLTEALLDYIRKANTAFYGRFKGGSEIEVEELNSLINQPTPDERLVPPDAFLGTDATRTVKTEIEKFNARNGTNIPSDSPISVDAFMYIARANDSAIGSKKNGGILELTKDISELLREGGILVPKADNGMQVTSNGRVSYGNLAYVDLMKLIDANSSVVDNVSYSTSSWLWKKIREDMDKILGRNTPNNENDDINKGVLQGPYRNLYTGTSTQMLNGLEAAAERERSEYYTDFTDAVVEALESGQITDPEMLDYLKYLQKEYGSRTGNKANFINYVDDNGKVTDIAKAVAQYKLLRNDSNRSYKNYSMGPHHHLVFKRLDKKHYYVNNKEITGDELNKYNLGTDFEQKAESWTDDTHDLHYVLKNLGDGSGDGNTGNGDTGGGTTGGGSTGGTGNGGSTGGTEIITPTTDDLYKDLNLTNRINWGNINETLRVLALNGLNQRAFEQYIDWQPNQVGYLNRYGILKGNKPVVNQANENAARLNLQAEQTYSNDAALQLAGQLEATDKGNQGKMQAALADTQEFFRTQERNQSIANEDLAYNRKAADTNLGLIAEKAKDTAQARAQLTLTKATNLSNLAAGFSKQMFDRYNNITEMLKQRQLLKEANRRAAAAKIFQAKLDNLALTTTDYKTYSDQLKLLQQEYLDTIGKYDAEDLETMRKIIGRRIILTPDLKGYFAKKGRKLSADNHYILQASKDYNRRKLAEAKEFYKNIRENNKRRKS